MGKPLGICGQKAVSDPAVVRRAVITGLGVGTLLTAVNQGPALIVGTLPATAPVHIVLSYLIPWSCPP